MGPWLMGQAPKRMMGLQPTPIHFSVHRRQIYQEVLHTCRTSAFMKRTVK